MSKATVKEGKMKKEAKKGIGVNLYKVDEVRRVSSEGNTIPYPTLAYVHVMVDTGYGTMILRNHRILEGKNGRPFVARPGKSRKIYDKNQREVGTQRFNDIRIEGSNDAEFDKDLREAILKAYSG
jgi:hypothetical protein